MQPPSRQGLFRTLGQRGRRFVEQQELLQFLTFFPIVLRWLLGMAIAVRLAILHESYVGFRRGATVAAVAAVFGFSALTTLRRFRRPSKATAWIFTAFDLAFVTLAYALTNSSQSSLFLGYILPLLTAAVNLDGFALVVVWACTGAVFAPVSYMLEATPPPAEMAANATIIKILVSRESFFGVAGVIAVLVHAERRRRERLETIPTALLDFRNEVDKRFTTTDVLDSTLTAVMTAVRAAGAAVYELEDGSRMADAPLLVKGTLATASATVLHQIRPLADASTRSVEAVVRGDMTFHERLPFSPRETREVICVPLVAHHSSYGVVVAVAGPSGFDKEAVAFAPALVAQAAAAISRSRRIAALKEIANETAATFDADHHADDLLAEIERCGCTFAVLFLADKYRRCLEAVRGRNVPRGWLRRSHYAIDAGSPHDDAFKLRRSQLINGWDDRLDAETYTLFEQANVARAFIPVVADGEAVGVVEAGVPRDDASTLEALLPTLEALIARRAASVAKAHPFKLVALIADRAMQVIGADAASIHVVDEHDVLLCAGAGEATPAFVARFSPRPNGIGRTAIRMKLRQVVDDPDKLRNVHPQLFAIGIRCLAAFPLDIAPTVHGILYVHYRRQQRLSEADLTVEQVFADQIQVAIRTQMLLRRTRDTAEDTWRVTILHRAMQNLASRTDLTLPDALDEIAKHVLWNLDADTVALVHYPPYAAEAVRFAAPVIIKGTLPTPALESAIRHALPQVAERVLGLDSCLVAAIGASSSSELWAEAPLLEAAVRTAGARRLAVLPLGFKAAEGAGSLGLLFVFHKQDMAYDTEERRRLDALASSVTIAVRALRMAAQSNLEVGARTSGDAELARAVRGIDHDLVRRTLVNAATALTSAQCGAMFLVDRASRRLIPDPSVAIGRDGASWIPHHRQLDIAMQVVQTGRPVVTVGTPSVAPAGSAMSDSSDGGPEIVVPLVGHGHEHVLAALMVASPDPGTVFADEHCRALEMLAFRGVVALNAVEVAQQHRGELKARRALSVVMNQIQGVQHDLDTVLRLLLTALTCGEGLGFSRAYVFLVDESGETLSGRMAIGGLDLADARANWEAVEAQSPPAEHDAGDEHAMSVLAAVIERAERFSREVIAGNQVERPLCRHVQGITIPVHSAAGAVVESLRGRRQIGREAERSDPLRAWLAPDDSTGGQWPFACTPLASGERTIGVIVVDNRFLPSEPHLDDAAVEQVKVFAEWGAVFVEYLRLREQTRTRSTEALVHEMKGPLRMLDLLTSVLAAKHPVIESSDTFQRWRANLRRAWRVASGLRLFTQLLSASSPQGKGKDISPATLLSWVRDAVDDMRLLHESSTIELSYDPRLAASNDGRVVVLDHEWIRQALDNVIDNAVKYSDEDEPQPVTVQVSDGPCTIVTVRNVGLPLIREDIEHCTESGWRHKKADESNSEGAGFGLYVVNHVMRTYRGELRIDPTNDRRETAVHLVFPPWQPAHTGLAPA